MRIKSTMNENKNKELMDYNTMKKMVLEEKKTIPCAKLHKGGCLVYCIKHSLISVLNFKKALIIFFAFKMYRKK